MIDKNKQYRTRDGREVRIYATDGGGHPPVHGAVQAVRLAPGDSEWATCQWVAEGFYCIIGAIAAKHPLDLIEVKLERTLWVNCYPEFASGYAERSTADECQSPGRLACVKVTFREGDGLEEGK